MTKAPDYSAICYLYNSKLFCLRSDERYHRPHKSARKEHEKVIAELDALSGVPWVRKFGYLCIQEILVLRKSSVQT